ncbi:YihY/virulence factor BrkB family protein [Mobilicoccus pelagius]|nr:YihY/virulence factor BrkB family protein [Mobilicoccus pelagius]
MATAYSDTDNHAGPPATGAPASTHDDTSGGEPAPKKFIEKVKESRPVRAFMRFGKARGGLLAGGIAYTSLFSIVSALTIAWTVFAATLGDDPALREQVIEAVNKALPGILKDSSGSGMIDPNSLVLETALNPASIVAALVLLWSAIGLMSNIRSTIQAMFGIIAPAENFAVAKLRDLLGFVVMALGIVLSSLLGGAATTMGSTVLGWIGLGDNPVTGFLLRALGFVIAASVAALTFAFLFRVTAAVRPLKKDLWLGSALGGVAVTVVLTLGTSIVKSASDNPLLAASAALVTLLLFVNLLAQVLMLVSAFTANPPSPDVPQSPEEVHFHETPNFVTLSDPSTLDWKHQDVTGQIDVDETLRPGYRKPKSRDRRPGDHDVRPDGQPMEVLASPWSVGRIRRRARRHERAAVELRAQLGQRPRTEAAEAAYWTKRGVTGTRRRKRTS